LTYVKVRSKDKVRPVLKQSVV